MLVSLEKATMATQQSNLEAIGGMDKLSLHRKKYKGTKRFLFV